MKGNSMGWVNSGEEICHDQKYNGFIIKSYIAKFPEQPLRPSKKWYWLYRISITTKTGKIFNYYDLQPYNTKEVVLKVVKREVDRMLKGEVQGGII